MSFRSSKHSHAWFHLRSWPNARISKRLLPILPTALQLLYQNFARGNDPAADYAAYVPCEQLDPRKQIITLPYQRTPWFHNQFFPVWLDQHTTNYENRNLYKNLTQPRLCLSAGQGGRDIEYGALKEESQSVVFIEIHSLPRLVMCSCIPSILAQGWRWRRFDLRNLTFPPLKIMLLWCIWRTLTFLAKQSHPQFPLKGSLA